MITIPLGLDEETVAKVDLLVKKGLYKSRSEALRDQILKGLDRIQTVEIELGNNETYNEILGKMLQWSSPPNLLPTRKTITELVAEGRER